MHRISPLKSYEEDAQQGNGTMFHMRVINIQQRYIFTLPNEINICNLPHSIYEKMDQTVFEYAGKYITPESTVLHKLNRETHLTQIYPQMLAGSLQGMLLQMIS